MSGQVMVLGRMSRPLEPALMPWCCASHGLQVAAFHKLLWTHTMRGLLCLSHFTRIPEIFDAMSPGDMSRHAFAIAEGLQQPMALSSSRFIAKKSSP